jgi:toxin ParE1/3/4
VKLIWTTQAVQDRLDIWEYICAKNPIAAVKLDEAFSEAASRLTKYPKLGKVGQILGTYELVLHESYRLVYQIDQGTIWLLALVHTAKQWPPILKPNH